MCQSNVIGHPSVGWVWVRGGIKGEGGASFCEFLSRIRQNDDDVELMRLRGMSM